MTGAACTGFGIEIATHHMKKTVLSAKEITHERIVGAAARAIRRSGYNGTSVSDIMKDVGLTHGGFYAMHISRHVMQCLHKPPTAPARRGLL